MKEKFLAFLMMLSLPLGFVSCSDDDDNDGGGKEVYAEGVSDGEDFAEAYEAYKSAEESLDKITAGLNLYKEYEEYKSNKADEDYKKGFLEGVSGASQNEKVQDAKEVLEKFDGVDFSNLSWTDIGEKVVELLK